MMQQTRIDTGIRYWSAFLERWPTVFDLAKAKEEEVMKAWQGLGYYNRARNLLAAARAVVEHHGGQFPQTAQALRQLPGVGPYTSAAISSICFGEPAAAVDGNVIRVLSRLFDVNQPVDKPEGRQAIDALAKMLVPGDRPGDHNQGMMELGALVCKPRNPICHSCPVSIHCVAREREVQAERPIKSSKTKIQKMELTFVVLTNGTHVAFRQRPKSGIWGGLWTFLEQDQVPKGLGDPRGHAIPEFEHILTHRIMRLSFSLQAWNPTSKSEVTGKLGPDVAWLPWEEAEELALPRAVEKIWPDAVKSARKMYI